MRIQDTDGTFKIHTNVLDSGLLDSLLHTDDRLGMIDTLISRDDSSHDNDDFEDRLRHEDMLIMSWQNED